MAFIQFNKRYVSYCLDICLKIIPVFLAVFIVGNVCFNVFYFQALRSEWVFLLSLSDYYEGNLFVIRYSTDILLLVLGCFFIQKFLKLVIKETALSIKLLWAKCKSWYKIYLFYRSLKRKVKQCKAANTFSYKRRRRFAQQRKEIKRIIKDWQKESDIKVMFEVLIDCIICILLVGSFAFQIYELYVVNWQFIICVVFMYSLICFFQHQTKEKKLVFMIVSVFLYWGLMAILGGIIAFDKPTLPSIAESQLFLKRYPSFVIIRSQQKSYVLKRAIAKGVLVTDDENMYFFPWDDVETVWQKTKKQEKTNAKK